MWKLRGFCVLPNLKIDKQRVSSKLIKIILWLYLKASNAPSHASSVLTSSLPSKQQH